MRLLDGTGLSIKNKEYIMDWQQKIKAVITEENHKLDRCLRKTQAEIKTMIKKYQATSQRFYLKTPEAAPDYLAELAKQLCHTKQRLLILELNEMHLKKRQASIQHFLAVQKETTKQGQTQYQAMLAHFQQCDRDFPLFDAQHYKI
jgi:predicted transcriptional regulator